jgi:hypothetical protein
VIQHSGFSTRIWNIDIERRTCTCRVHGEGAPLRVRKRNDRVRPDLSCRKCDRGANPCRGDTKAQRLRKKYGIDYSGKASMVAGQGGVCAICGGPLDPGNIDHDHKTGRIRGVLCTSCNVGLGFFRDDIASLKSAIEYLNRSEPITAPIPTDALF